jgi:hypothetical protein
VLEFALGLALGGIERLSRFFLEVGNRSQLVVLLGARLGWMWEI